jgi:energy-coupling factor transport system substrate-specific component
LLPKFDGMERIIHNEPNSVTPLGAALALVPLGVLTNLAIGTIVHLLKLPLFIDAVGTILVTLLIGIRWGVVAGVLSFLIGGVLVNPVMPYFSATQATIAIVTGLLASHGWFRSVPRTVVAGIVVGIAAAIASAPVIITLFGGITGSGSGFITAFLLASGKKIVESVVLTGISCEPIDKTLQCLIAFWLVQSLPARFRERFAALGYLRQNTPASK